MAGNGKGVAAGALLVVLGILSGAFAALEKEFSPGFARASLDLWHQVDSGSFASAKTLLTEMLRGNTDEDKIAAKAACSFLVGQGARIG